MLVLSKGRNSNPGKYKDVQVDCTLILSFKGYYIGRKKKSSELVKREVTEEDGISVVLLFTFETGDDTIHKYVATISSILARSTFFRP